MLRVTKLVFCKEVELLCTESFFYGFSSCENLSKMLSDDLLAVATPGIFITEECDVVRRSVSGKEAQSGAEFAVRMEQKEGY
jgi:hypothetical protein